MSQPKIAIEQRQTATGRFRVQVLDARTRRVVRKGKWQRNLILDSGLDYLGGNYSWAACIAYCAAGTGTTPTKDLADGTYSQSGTTVTRNTGTRSFISGDVGKVIRWTSGEEAYITAFTNTTTVTVGTSQTVSAGAIDALYRVAQTGLTTEIARTATYPAFTDEEDSLASQATILNHTDGKITLKRTYDFPEEASSKNYTEIGVSPIGTAGANLFSRMLLAGAVTVGIGQLLRVVYELTIVVQGAVSATQSTVNGGITGWPLPYDIESIVSNGTYWEVTLTEAHHFQASGKININGAKRPRAAITAASSTVSDFTITAAGHGLSGGQTAVIEGMTPSGYNGSFTVDSVSGDDVTILSVLNPGTGTVFGNIRQQEPGTWYDGTDYVIASVPSSTKVRITNATSIAAAGEDGTAYNDTKRKFKALCYGVEGVGTLYETNGDTPTYATAATVGMATSGTTRAFLEKKDSGTYLHIGIPTTPPTFRPLGFPRVWKNTTSATGTTAAGACVDIDGNNDSGAAVHAAVGSSNYSKASAGDTYTVGTFRRDYTFVFAAGDLNLSNINLIYLASGTATSDVAIASEAAQGFIEFEQPQRKKSTYKLTLVVRRSWGRDLSVIPN
jgi:hypothetical protein